MLACGRGLLSSQKEASYSRTDATPGRVACDVERVMATDYAIDDFQKTYFVLTDYQQLFDAMDADFAAIYDRLTHRPAIDPSVTLAGDQLYHVHGDENHTITMPSGDPAQLRHA